MTNTAAAPVDLAVLPFARHEIVDLSVTIAEDLPCYWTTHQPFRHTTWNWFTDGPYATRWMAIDEHTGTHVDAPLHFVPPPDSGLPGAGAAGEISAERVPLEQLLGPAAVIDVSALAGTETDGGVSPLIERETLAAWEAEHGNLRPGDIVLLRTGWDRRYRRGADGHGYLRDVLAGRCAGWPAPSVATVGVLLDRGVRCVGIDAPSIGPAHDPAPVHVRGLREGAVFVECLAGLASLPARGAWFAFLPLKVEGGTGAPGRAIAFIPRS